jgi:hypothetical protein
VQDSRSSIRSSIQVITVARSWGHQIFFNGFVKVNILELVGVRASYRWTPSSEMLFDGGRGGKRVCVGRKERVLGKLRDKRVSEGMGSR